MVFDGVEVNQGNVCLYGWEPFSEGLVFMRVFCCCSFYKGSRVTLTVQSSKYRKYSLCGDLEFVIVQYLYTLHMSYVEVM